MEEFSRYCSPLNPNRWSVKGKTVSASRLATVIIVDDHSIMRDGLKEVLDRSGEYEVVGQARDGDEAVKEILRLKPDVVIMDLIMPAKDGVEACRDITASLPETKVLVLTASTDAAKVLDAVAAGATGYLQKFSGKEKLLETIREVLAGEFRVPRELMQRALTQMRTGPEQVLRTDSEVLTQRDLEILKLFAEGRNYAEIAETRGNRPLTIRNAVYAIRDKLGVNSRQEMVVWAVRNGLLDNGDA